MARLRRSVPALLLLASLASAQSSGELDTSRSGMAQLIERYTTDRASLGRRYRVPMSPARRARMKRFHEDWLARIGKLPFDPLEREGRIDWILFRNLLRHELRQLDEEARRDAEVAPLLPFWKSIVDLAEARRALEPIEPRAAAEAVESLRHAVEAADQALQDPKKGADPILVNRASERLGALRRALGSWFRYYDGYDPLFSWWVGKPYEEADAALAAFAKTLQGRRGEGDATLIGDPIGREALLGALAYEMVPYTPEELIAIAEKELGWCDAEMEKAARAMGCKDWREAQEKVKGMHVEPGKQPGLIRDLALDAVRFLDERDLVTIPPLCRETWRMEMMSPERQRTSPYFLGGETILVSFPTGAMSHRDKLMSLRGNNVHFVRAVVHHELIPGHHLQGFMNERWRTHRRIFRTPFWIEGWALYWEMLLWDLGFPRGPEDRIGMLFWRKHRCARIIFSLRFHLGEMTAPEAVDFLVARIGHERNNAEAEVRRSVGGAYGPLYQAAYMLGGLQIMALRRELVDSGKMTDRAFHDAILRRNAIPIEMVRRALTGQPPAKDFTPAWRFYSLD
jgi:uncharacterized protein (DUF885 family)